MALIDLSFHHEKWAIDSYSTNQYLKNQKLEYTHLRDNFYEISHNKQFIGISKQVTENYYNTGISGEVTFYNDCLNSDIQLIKPCDIPYFDDTTRPDFLYKGIAFDVKTRFKLYDNHFILNGRDYCNYLNIVKDYKELWIINLNANDLIKGTYHYYFLNFHNFIMYLQKSDYEPKNCKNDIITIPYSLMIKKAPDNFKLRL